MGSAFSALNKFYQASIIGCVNKHERIGDTDFTRCSYWVGSVKVNN